jgi:hypothetical protein
MQVIHLYGGEVSAFENLILGGNSRFDVLFAGWRNTNGDFYGIGKNGYFWTMTEETEENAWKPFSSGVSRAISFNAFWICRSRQERSGTETGLNLLSDDESKTLDFLKTFFGQIRK